MTARAAHRLVKKLYVKCFVREELQCFFLVRMVATAVTVHLFHDDSLVCLRTFRCEDLREPTTCDQLHLLLRELARGEEVTTDQLIVGVMTMMLSAHSMQPANR